MTLATVLMNEHQQKYLRQEKCTFNYYRESDNMDGFLFNVFWKTQMRKTFGEQVSLLWYSTIKRPFNNYNTLVCF